LATITRTNLATNPSCEASTSTNELRRNYVENPRAVSATTGWSYVSGTGESSTITNSNATGPNKLPGMITATVGTAKTGGNSGFYRNETVSGVTGDPWTGSVWVRASAAVTMHVQVYLSLGGTGVVTGVGTAVTLAANTWTQLSATATATGSYDRVQVYAVMDGTQILPAAATLDATQMLVEQASTVGTYFDGDYPAFLRTNWAGNPEAVTATTGFAAYTLGTTEAGAVSFVTGASDGPIPGLTTYARQTVSTAKTTASSGWSALGSSVRAFMNGLAGDYVTASVYLRSSVATSVIMRTAVYSPAGSTINFTDAASVPLPANTWVRVSCTLPGAGGDYSSVGWWAYQNSTTILPVGATLDATGSLVEPGAAPGTFFSGNTADPAGVTYAWSGTVNNSVSRLTDNDLTFAWTGAANASAAALTVQRVAGLSTGISGALSYRSTWWADTGAYSMRQTATGHYDEFAVSSSGMVPGQTYTIMVTSYSTAPIVGTGARRMVQLRAYGSATTYPLTVTAPAGQVGAYVHIGTFVCPSDATSYSVRFTPDQAGGTDIWWDSLVVVQGTYTGPYFDGSSAPYTNTLYSPAAQTSFAWTGAANASTSVQTDVVPLQNYQVQLPDGSVLGAGQPVGLLESTGLRDAASLRSADTDNSQQDGSTPGMSYVTRRTVGFKFQIAAPQGGAAAAYAPLAANWQNTRDPSTVAMTAGSYLSQLASGGTLPVSALQVQLPGQPAPYLLLGKPTKLTLPVDFNYQLDWWEIGTEWEVPDGLIYGAVPNTASCTPLTSSGGAGFAWHFPVTFPTSSGGTLTAANNGKYPARPVYRITGPINNPRIMNASTGQAVQINLSLVAGDVLIVDTASRAVRLNGANRNTALDISSSFFNVQPGGTSIRFSSSDATSAGVLTVFTLDTYSTIV
jgi:hypothetical protein